MTENESEVRDSTSRGKDMESKSFSESPRRHFKTLSGSQQYNNISSNQEKDQNRPNFITLGKISEEEKIEIIQRGFQLQAEGKLSLKKYYGIMKAQIQIVYFILKVIVSNTKVFNGQNFINN